MRRNAAERAAGSALKACNITTTRHTEHRTSIDYTYRRRSAHTNLSRSTDDSECTNGMLPSHAVCRACSQTNPFVGNSYFHFLIIIDNKNMRAVLQTTAVTPMMSP
jgi:hypothetical protein